MECYKRNCSSPRLLFSTVVTTGLLFMKRSLALVQGHGNDLTYLHTFFFAEYNVQFYCRYSRKTQLGEPPI